MKPKVFLRQDMVAYFGCTWPQFHQEVSFWVSRQFPRCLHFNCWRHQSLPPEIKWIVDDSRLIWGKLALIHNVPFVLVWMSLKIYCTTEQKSQKGPWSSGSNSHRRTQNWSFRWPGWQKTCSTRDHCQAIWKGCCELWLGCLVASPFSVEVFCTFFSF